MRVQDGNVLIQTIVCSSWPAISQVTTQKDWPGVTNVGELPEAYVRQLYAMSSPLPASRHSNLREYGYHIDPDAVMIWPGAYPNLPACCLPLTSTS